MARIAQLSLLLGLGFALIVPARLAVADPVSADTLQSQLRAALGDLAGPANGPDSARLTVTQKDDHYRIVWPLFGMAAADGAAVPSLTAVIHPLDGGSWSVDDVQFPQALAFKLPAMAPQPQPGALHVQIGAQQTHAIFDPSFATESSFTAALHDIGIDGVSPEGHQIQHFESYLVAGMLKPRPDGRLDLDETGALKGYIASMTVTGKPPVQFSADRAGFSARAESVNRNRIGPVFAASLRVMSALITQASAAKPGAPPSMPAIDKQTLRDFVSALNDVAASVKVTESLDGLKIKAADQTFALDRATVGFGGDTPGGLLKLYLDVALDGFSWPGAPPDLQAYQLRHLRLHPWLSGVDSADILKIALLALDDKGPANAVAPAMTALFAHGGLKIGLDPLELELGPAKITGTVLVTLPAPSPAAIIGEGHIAAIGLDALIKQLQSEPSAARVLPELMQARQLAKPDGDALVWDVAYGNGALRVNGKDLMPPHRAQAESEAPQVQH